MSTCELFTVAQMAEADRLAVQSGVPSLTLMENAGRAVAEETLPFAVGGAAVVLCGPGNNGGDGFVAAQHLKERGREVRVALFCEREALCGDAAVMAARWDGPIAALSPAVLEGAEVIIDALFGAGLSRSLDGRAREIVAAANASGRPIVAVDMPSGISGDTGQILEGASGSTDGQCVAARATITFHRKKLGHLLLPGRLLCGAVSVADIGIPAAVGKTIRIQTYENLPALWQDGVPWPSLQTHKYKRGHALVVSGPAHATGAARLAARGALRIGAGLVSVASQDDAVAVNAAHLTAVMVKPFAGAVGLSDLLSDKRFTAVALGPGLGLKNLDTTQGLIEAALASGAYAVLDADALIAFEHAPKQLFDALHANCALTPHEGEFKRLFPGLLESNPSRLEAACAAAALAGCIIVLKGPDTVVAAPDGRASINANAPAWLATAGAGDVLAGMIAGLFAQAMPPFEAASAAVWLHGEAARTFGLGLIAEDLPEALPDVFKRFREKLL